MLYVYIEEEMTESNSVNSLASAIYDSVINELIVTQTENPFVVKLPDSAEAQGAKVYEQVPYEQLPAEIHDRLYDLASKVKADALFGNSGVRWFG